jgi:hypothetical protein
MSDRDKPTSKTRDALEERAKELACLYEIGDLLKDPEAAPRHVLDLVVQVIQTAWQHPETWAARITLEHLTFQSSGFREVSHAHKADILVEGKRVGTIEVCCTQRTLQAPEEAFLPEKCRFIDMIARRVGEFLSLQHLRRLLVSDSVLGRELWSPDNHDSTDETGRPTPPETEHGGLCMTCVHSSTCAFLQREGQPVLSCEEFDDSEGRPTEIAGADDPLVPEPQAQVADVKHEPPAHTGLCATCDNRETCTFPKPEGGIWHCEEFA